MPRYIVPLFLLLAALACNLTSKPSETPFPTRLGDHLNRAVEAQAQVADLWDRLLFGDPVSCAESLTVPPPFDLTQPDADRYPASVAIRDYLNAALDQLALADALWEQECQLLRPVVPLAVVRQAEDALQTAQDLLARAVEAWVAWQA
jgi:hypothetical protein